MTRIKLATVWLDGCSGCHMSLVDVDEDLGVIARRADLVYGPLVDAQEFPEGVDVTLVEGAVSSQDDLKKIQTIRRRSRLIVALGDCAVTGNVPSMRNGIPVKHLIDQVYVSGATPGATSAPVLPLEGIPPLLKRAVPVHEVVPVDVHVPGCPPSAATILRVVTDLLDGRKPDVGSAAKFG